MEDEADDVLIIADKYQGSMERALIRAFKSAQNDANIARFEREFGRGDLLSALNALQLAGLDNKLIDG
jgi:hypothetical protein